jgi:hypothetical protein
MACVPVTGGDGMVLVGEAAEARSVAVTVLLALAVAGDAVAGACTTATTAAVTGTVTQARGRA